MQPCWNCWGNLNHYLDENDQLEFDILSLHLSLKYLQNLLYHGKIIVLCLRYLLWNQHQTMIWPVTFILYGFGTSIYIICIIAWRFVITTVLFVSVFIFMWIVFVIVIVDGSMFDKEIFWTSFTCFSNCLFRSF